MMIRKPGIYQSAMVLALAALGMSPAAALGARRGPQPKFVTGQFILYCQPGTPMTDVQAIASTVNAASVTPLAFHDFYQVMLPVGKTQLTDVTDAITQVKLDPRVRSAEPNYYVYKLQTGGSRKTIPNDPLFSEQWDMPLINMPQAWVLQKGAATANVAVLDTGFDATHPDLVGKNLPDGMDFTVTPATGNIQPAGDQHGVHVSGTIVANTNNGLGVAGIAGWGKVQVLPVKVLDATGAGTFTMIANGLNYVLSRQAADHIVAINMSLGGGGDPTDTTSVLYVATKACADAGITVVCAAGNDDADAHQFVPSGFPFVISVAATDKNAQKAFYSNFSKIEIAAPGGAADGITADDVISTINGGYDGESGTSMASPHVAGVVALLRSVPGVTALKVWDYNNPASSILLSNANRTITAQTSVPDTNYGYGFLDAYAALKKVSFVVQVANPIGIDPVTQLSTDPTGQPPAPQESLKPNFQFVVSNIPIANVTITLISPSLITASNATGTQTLYANGQIDPNAAARLSGFTTLGDTSGANGPYTIQFRYRIDTVQPQEQEQIVLTGQPADATIAAVTDTRNFTLIPHQFQSGLAMVSFPIYESAADAPPTDPSTLSTANREALNILNAKDTILYRWAYIPDPTNGTLAVQSLYATYTYNDQDPLQLQYPAQHPTDALASLHPTDVTTVPDPITTASNVSPLGIGYFMRLSQGAQFKSYGLELANQSVRVPVHQGWNMIGNPFPFQVSFSNLQVETPAGTRLKIGDAVAQGLLLPFIYRYIPLSPTTGQYTVDQLPGGTLVAWEGAWIYITPQSPYTFQNPNPKSTLTLIVPPTGSATGRATAHSSALTSRVLAQKRVSGSGSWVLQLSAQSGELADSNNFIGTSATATDADDQTKAPKPPMMSPYVSLGILRSNGLYAQDLRALGGAKTWNVVVATDQPGKAVTLSWPNIGAVPRSVQLILKDTATGQTLDMRQQHSYQFHPDSKSTSRSFTIQAKPGFGAGRAILSGLFVNPGKGRGAAASPYEINYQISREAQVDVTVLGPSGRLVNSIATSRAASTGQNRLYWNGQDLRGRALPSGTYQIQVRAVTPEGEVSRMIVPVILIGH